MIGVVPEPDRRVRDAVFIAECASARRTQHERFAMNWLHADPSCSQHSEKMPAGKNQIILRYGAQAAHYAISARCNLLWRFAAGTAVAEQLPVRTFLQNVNR